MDHLQTYTAHIRNRLLALFIANGILIIGGTYAVLHFLPASISLSPWVIAGAIAVFSALLMTLAAASYFVSPLKAIWQAVLHIAPDTVNIQAPDIRHVHVGKELVAALTGHIYQLANVADTIERTAQSKQRDLQADFVASTLPLPLLVLDKNLTVLFANSAFLRYTSRSGSDTTGQNIYLVLDMLFSTQLTFDSWLEHVRNSKVTATHTWERVRLNLPDQQTTKLFDLVAYYNKNNPDGFEVILTLFDRTRQYSQDEQAMSFLALAVHELRTPLTLLRGYIDAFEEDLEGQLNPELSDYLNKMKATAQQLASFIGNVLNVAKFENDQLTLQLREEQWAPLLQSAVDDMVLRAKVRGITFDTTIEDKLPAVGADAASMYEVINNILDNAIKYSKPQGKVSIRSYLTKDGQIETTIQDSGVGIPESAIGNLFEKFYRDYRNRTQVGGTGMGLYLSKVILTAHGGTIWVRSKEGQGSTFGFTLKPYSQVEGEKKNGREGIIRTAHGWIKNHSMYRR